jgi:dephospho-CoA kinase
MRMRVRMRVIGLVGRAGAGKDTVSEYMGRRYPSVRMGEVVIEETRRRGLEQTDENVGAVAIDLRKREGMDAIAKRCVTKIQTLDSPYVVVNGIRGGDEVRTFRSHFDDFVLVEVWAPDRTRYERILERSRPDDVRSFEEFLERDRREGSWGLDEAISMSSHRIRNDGSLSNLEEQAGKLIEKIESG